MSKVISQERFESIKDEIQKEYQSYFDKVEERIFKSFSSYIGTYKNLGSNSINIILHDKYHKLPLEIKQAFESKMNLS